MGTFTFDEDHHQYRLDGCVIPSVTQVLSVLKSDAFKDVPLDVLEAAGRRGTAVHKALENLDLGKKATVPAKRTVAKTWREEDRIEIDRKLQLDLSGYVDAARKFMVASMMKTIARERKGYHPTYFYAGTTDYIGKLGCRSLAIVDWKTGIITPLVPLQLAAYAYMLKDPLQYRRIAVKLSYDGTYKVHEYPATEIKRDFSVFLAALTCYRWRVRYNGDGGQ